MVQFHTKYFKVLQGAYTLSHALPPTTPNESKTSTSFLCLSRCQLHAQRRSASQKIDPELSQLEMLCKFLVQENRKTTRPQKKCMIIANTPRMPIPQVILAPTLSLDTARFRQGPGIRNLSPEGGGGRSLVRKKSVKISFWTCWPEFKKKWIWWLSQPPPPPPPQQQGNRVTYKHNIWVTSKHNDLGSLPNTI